MKETERNKVPFHTKYLIIILFFGLCFLAASTKLTSYDFWWHLKSGEIILERGEVLKKDIFSFTANGSPRIAHEWLAELFFYLLFQMGGIPAIIIWKAVIVSASFLLIFLYLHNQDIALRFIAVCTILSLWGARFRFGDRTELFSLFFATLILFLLFEYGRSGHRWKVYAIIPATLLWANFHGAAILSPLFILLFALGAVANKLIPRPFQRSEKEQPFHPFFFLHLTIVLFLAFCSTLINPNGIFIWKASLEAKAIHSSGFAVNTEWLRPEPTQFPLFYASMIVFLMVSALSIKKIDFSKFFITLFLLVMALIHLRAIGLFFFGLPFFLAVHLPRMGITDQGREFFQKILKSRIIGVLVVITIVLSIPFFLFHKGLQEFGFSMKEDRFPVEASRFLDNHYRGASLYNDVKFGGYLIWNFYPERKVFIDGRNELYVSLAQRISRGLQAHDKWLDLLEDYQIDAALVSYWPSLKGVVYPPDPEMGIARKGYRAYSAFLFLKKDWALVYWDDTAMIFFKRLDKFEDVIRKYEYQHINPEDWRYLLSISENDEDLRLNILKELTRRLQEKPESQRARALYRVFGREETDKN